MAQALWPHKRKLSEIAYLSKRYPVWCKLASNLFRIKTDTHERWLCGNGTNRRRIGF